MQTESQAAELHVGERQVNQQSQHHRQSSHLLATQDYGLDENLNKDRQRASATDAMPQETPFGMNDLSVVSNDQESGIAEQAGALNLEQVSLSSRTNLHTPCDEPGQSAAADIEQLKKNMTPEELNYVTYLIDNNKLDKVNGHREITPSPISKQEQHEEAVAAESDEPLTERDEEAGSDANDSRQLSSTPTPQSIDSQLKECWVAALPQIASLTLSKLTVFGGAFFVSWAGYHKIETPEATTAAIKAIGLGSMILSLLCCEICFGINATLETMVSQAYGASRNQLESGEYRAEMREACGRYLNMARVTTTVFLMLPTAGLFFFADDLLVHFFHQDPLVSGLAIQYCIMSMPAVWAISQFDATRRFLAAQSVGSLPLLVQMGTMLVHLVCSYLFIVKLEWGTLGVTISANASCILATLLLDLLVSMECDKEGDRFEGMWLSWAKCGAEDFGTFLSTSICNIIIRGSHQWSLQVILFMCGVNYLGSGRQQDELTRTFSAEFIMLNVLTWLTILPEGLQIAVTALVGQNIARRSLVKDAIRYSKVGYTLFVLFMGIACLLVNFFGMKLVARLESNQTIVNDIEKMLPLFLVLFTLLSSFIMLVGFLRGLKKLKFAAFASMLMFVGLGVPLAAILGEKTKQRVILGRIMDLLRITDQQISLFGFNLGITLAVLALNAMLAVYVGLVVDWNGQSKRIVARLGHMAEAARQKRNKQQTSHKHVPTSDLSLNEDLNKSEYAAIVQQPINESNITPMTDRYEFNTCIESSYGSIKMGEQDQWACGPMGNIEQMGAHLSQSYQYISADLRRSDADNLTMDQQNYIDQAQGSASDIMLSSHDRIEVNNILNGLRQGLGNASDSKSSQRSLDLSPMATSQQRIMTLQEQREWYLSQLRAIDDAQRHERLMQSQRMQAQF